MHRAAPEPVPMRTVISHVVPPILMGLVMTLAYLGGFHKPEPHGVPVAVVGSAATAGPVAAQIRSATGDMLDVVTVPSVDAAKEQLTTLHISGAYVPSKTHPTLLAATAEAPSNAQLVKDVFTEVAAKQDKPLTVTDVVPLTTQDPLGQNAFFYLVTLSVASYATAIAIGAAGSTRRFRERLGLLVGAAFVISTAELAFATVLFDMFGGHGGPVWAVSFLYSLIVLGIGVGLHTVVGRFSTLLFSAMFVALNFTSSGGVLAAEMQPGFFGWLNAFWIGGGFLDVMRHLVYFPHASVTHGVWVLTGWFLFGCACLALSHHIHWRRELAEATADDHQRLRETLRRLGQDGLTREQALELELQEDVAV
ncbi:membrane protein [Mobilicoccus pelagius]|nr:membrane protein [Mobilicoccus pelagius]